MEILRVLLATDFRPRERSIHFMAFAGEEGGLLGSKDVARAYAQEGRTIVGMLQLEMAGYRGRGMVTGMLSSRCAVLLYGRDIIFTNDTCTQLHTRLTRNKHPSHTHTVLRDTNAPLADFVSTLARTHLNHTSGIATEQATCNYACSDHYSFHSEGFPTVALAEASPHGPQLNPNIHRASDTLAVLDMDFLAQFARVGLAFAVEMSGGGSG